MAIEVSETLTRKIAHLARLELSDAETVTFTAQLKQILAYVEQLQQVDVSGVEPLTQPLDFSVEGANVSRRWREDEVKPSPVDDEGKPRVLSSAPDVLFDGFKVPPIL